VTGVDIVREQLRLAAGERLDLDQKDIVPKGHAIEWRINAEDPANKFAPSPGLVEWIHFPGGPGVRIDSHVYSGYSIPPYYDSLICKLITYGNTRDDAIRRMSRALGEFMVQGMVKTSVPLGQDIVSSSAFRRGVYNTAFFEDFLREWLGPGIKTAEKDVNA
jgi:acetyl-CoA carboxylase, biotin carboxylase subunit